MKKHVYMTAFVSALAATVSSSALAEQPAKGEKSKVSKDYEYRFDDDPLQAGAHGAYTAQIHVVKLGRRDRLIRPRTQFVTELIQSVEAL